MHGTEQSTNGKIGTVFDDLFVGRTASAVEQHQKSRETEVERRKYATELARQKLADDEALIEAKNRDQDGLASHEKGWAMEVFIVLAIVAIVLEWVPASLYTLVFFDATGSVPMLMTVAFTIIGVLCAGFIGELMRRSREPVERPVRDLVFLIVLGLGAVTFLAATYLLRIGYGVAGTTAFRQPISPTVQAFALTSIAAIAVLLAIAAGTYRESVKATRLRWQLSKLERGQRAAQRHAEALFEDMNSARIAAGMAPVPRPNPRPKVKSVLQQQQAQQNLDREQRGDSGSTVVSDGVDARTAAAAAYSADWAAASDAQPPATTAAAAPTAAAPAATPPVAAAPPVAAPPSAAAPPTAPAATTSALGPAAAVGGQPAPTLAQQPPPGTPAPP